MIKLSKSGFLFLTVIFLVALFGCGSRPKDFSADNIMKLGTMTQQGKVFFSGNKWRIETTVFGQPSISIFRADKKVMWSLMPAQKKYLEVKLEPKQLMGQSNRLPGEVKREKVASEVVNGVLCDKYLLTLKLSNQPVPLQVYQWLSKDNIAVKTASAHNSWSSEYLNIKVGPQSFDLFEVPAGYQKLGATPQP